MTTSHHAALRAGHAAAEHGHWPAAAAHFAEAAEASDADACGRAAALGNLGQALARAGRWPEAERALRDAVAAREALVLDGLAMPAVAARGWSDLAALLAAAGPVEEARAAWRRADDLADPSLRAALDETATMLGDAPVAFGPPAEVPRLHAIDDGTVPVLALADVAIDAARAAESAADAAERAVTGATGALEALDELALVSAVADEPEAVELDGADSLADALAAAIAEPEATATDAAREDQPMADAMAPAAPAHEAAPHAGASHAVAWGETSDASTDESSEPASADTGDALPWLALDEPATFARHVPAASPAVASVASVGADDAPTGTSPAHYMIDVESVLGAADGDEPELLTPGVELDDPRGASLAPGAGAPSDGVGHGPRIAAIDRIVALTEASTEPPKAGGLRGLLRRLTGR